MKRAVISVDGQHRVTVSGADRDVAYWLPKIIAARDAAIDASDPLMTIEQAASAVGRSAECVRQWCRSGVMGTLDTTHTKGGVWFIRRSDLVAFWVEHHGVAAIPAKLRELAAQ